MRLDGDAARRDRKRMNEKPVIHVIDGDGAVRDSIAMLLQVEGFVVHLYPSGVAFLRQADLAEPSCLVISMHLPGLSGATILGLFRSWGIPVHIVAMINIANVDPCSVAMNGDSLLLGSVVLKKPFSGLDLLRSIEIVTRGGRSAELPMLNITAEAEQGWGGVSGRQAI
jgi:two-component system, LuxR family, response regulator FixJ